MKQSLPKTIKFLPLLFISLFSFTITSIHAQTPVVPVVARLMPDTLCNEFALDNRESIIRVIGTSAWNHAIVYSPEYPRLVLRNSTNTEQLELIQHYGNKDFNVSEFRISRVNDSDTNTAFLRTTILNFFSGKNITLGMSSEEVQNQWGFNGKIIGSSSKYMIQYRIFTGPYMKTHFKTMYYANYSFSGNELISFSYGFDYE